MTRIIFFFLEFAVVVVLIFAQNVTKKIFGALYDHSFSKIPSIVMKIFVLEKKKKNTSSTFSFVLKVKKLFRGDEVHSIQIFLT